MLKVGLIGWRGMVGSVLCDRFTQENDWDYFEPHFFSTTKAGEVCKLKAAKGALIKDAGNIDDLSKMDILVSCQGGSYTENIHPQLRASGWQGYWIDSSSSLRMKADSIIVLDPVNGATIEAAIKNGTCLDFIGGNCTISLLLLAIHGLVKADLVEWVSSMTYQAASGAGAAFMNELLAQNAYVGRAAELGGPTALEKELTVREALKGRDFPQKNIGVPLATSLIPWIDVPWAGGQTKEEWKAMAEGNKILNRTEKPIIFEGLCVRVSSLRCHSQGLTIKLRQPLPLKDVEQTLTGANEWVDFIPNEMAASRQFLTPTAISGSLRVAIGRVHHLAMGEDYIGAFTVGDQLLWGAAEPLRRVLRMLLNHLEN